VANDNESSQFLLMDHRIFNIITVKPLDYILLFMTKHCFSCIFTKFSVINTIKMKKVGVHFCPTHCILLPQFRSDIGHFNHNTW